MFYPSLPRHAHDSQWSNSSISWNSTACAPASTINSTVNSSQIVEIVVGAAGQLAFNPSSVSVTPGTTLRFDFLGLNHTLTQSSSASLCHNSSGFDTGFQQFNPQNISGTFLVDYLVESDRPQWFYCAQDEPISHCHSGMVFSVNPSNDTYESANETRPSDSPSSSAPIVTTLSPMTSLCTSVPLSASPNKTVASDGTASLTFQPYPTAIVPELSNNARRLTYALPSIAGLLFMAIM
ncbi:hypothetical protein PSPO01_14873 [Paraphaeosphaeria sporulosa]